ncbi:MAG: type II methionyl aminopeptidase [Candidatus Diapherotrites archaeon]|nr:type II methionyl aminopeptidase [Candidatus Diapherotrites archaeon]
MNAQLLENYLKAGDILRKTQELARKEAFAGQSLLELALKLEENIFKLGGKTAFPVNLSANHVAAHFTPSAESKETILAEDVLKIDIGVHVNGCIADAAFTTDFSGKNGALVDASHNALEAAVRKIRIGTPLHEIGSVIEQAIRVNGFSPILNLTGHGLDVFDAHTEPVIPNTGNEDPTPLKEGMAFAVEPFATTGPGIVHEGHFTEIYSLNELKPVRGTPARIIQEFTAEKYQKLPFALRQLQPEMELSELAFKTGIRELIQKEALMAYPILQEPRGTLVSQAETCFAIFNGKVHRLV